MPQVKVVICERPYFANERTVYRDVPISTNNKIRQFHVSLSDLYGTEFAPLGTLIVEHVEGTYVRITADTVDRMRTVIFELPGNWWVSQVGREFVTLTET